MGRRRRGDRGQRRADHPDHGDHRHRDLAAGQLGLPGAAIPGHGARPGRPVRPAERLGRASSTSCAARSKGYGIGSRSPNRSRSTCRPSPGPSPCATRGRSHRRRRRRRPPATWAADDASRRAARSPIAAVALVLGLLVVVQLRAQAGERGPRPAVVAGPDVLVANLNARNDQLRREIVVARGRARDARPRTSRAATCRSTRSGPTSNASGPMPGSTRSAARASRSRSRARSMESGVEELINELRNAGAEAIAIGDVRVVAGRRGHRSARRRPRSTARALGRRLRAVARSARRTS